ncbi:helix-turn-helix domain-containing protein [Anatilimnocola sp. NA78]|uniref:helix-turn-helix domain-containing protein n=1 Tax=Anatilimnocola sp. NA78 TaxID=3415683 RepID=UPI003CE4DFFF
MTHPSAEKHLYDPRSGAAAISMLGVAVPARGWEPPRTNCFSVYWIESGSGDFWADAARHSFAANSLLFFVPYQYIRFVPAEETRGVVIQFHANFLCVETFHAESGCAGSLFSDLYHPPVIGLPAKDRREVTSIIKRMQQEQQDRDLAYEEMLLAQLKVLLILATRLKAQQTDACWSASRVRHPVLGQLKELIDQHYATLHAPADYAKLLHMTPKTLGRIVREQLGKSLTDLIRERILTHAKWQILHTLKSVKEVAREVGFSDELYFSRMFKKATGYSPTFFREFETEIRGGSNLSILSVPAPILKKRSASDTYSS